MTIRNQIRLATVKEYTGNYATIILRQGEGFFSEADRTIEETMVTRINSVSKALPDTGVDVLIAFDDTGGAYVLGVVGSDNQPLPVPDEPGAMVQANVDDDPLNVLTLKHTEDGKISASKTDVALGALEIINLLVEAVKEISISTVAAGGGPLLNAALILAFSTKLDKFKV